jgi:preprotein translocase subunit SecE
MDTVKVPQEWPRRKKVRSIVITVLFIIVVLLILVD